MPIKENLEHELQINDLKRVKMFRVDDKVMHYKWLAGHIAEDDENAPWVNGESIYRHTLKFNT